MLAGRLNKPQLLPNSFSGRSGRSRGGGGRTELCATHEEMLWTVILGELVVNCLVAVGRVVDGVPRRVLRAGRSSLDVIGNKWGA